LVENIGEASQILTFRLKSFSLQKQLESFFPSTFCQTPKKGMVAALSTSLNISLNENTDFLGNLFCLWSISPTFYARIFRTKVLLYFCQSQNVTRENLREALLYKNACLKH